METNRLIKDLELIEKDIQNAKMLLADGINAIELRGRLCPALEKLIKIRQQLRSEQ